MTLKFLQVRLNVGLLMFLRNFLIMIILSFYRLCPQTFITNELRDFTLTYFHNQTRVLPQDEFTNQVEILSVNPNSQIEFLSC